jgi:hypothetical protein
MDSCFNMKALLKNFFTDNQNSKHNGSNSIGNSSSSDSESDSSSSLSCDSPATEKAPLIVLNDNNNNQIQIDLNDEEKNINKIDFNKLKIMPFNYCNANSEATKRASKPDTSWKNLLNNPINGKRNRSQSRIDIMQEFIMKNRNFSKKNINNNNLSCSNLRKGSVDIMALKKNQNRLSSDNNSNPNNTDNNHGSFGESNNIYVIITRLFIR